METLHRHLNNEGKSFNYSPGIKKQCFLHDAATLGMLIGLFGLTKKGTKLINHVDKTSETRSGK